MRIQLRISPDVKYSFETFIELYKAKNIEKDIKEDYGSIISLAINIIKDKNINWIEISKCTQIEKFEGINTTINFGDNSLKFIEKLTKEFKSIFNKKRVFKPMVVNMIITAAINEIAINKEKNYMKAFDFEEQFESKYPKDLEEIKDYLKSKGTINVKYKTLDSLYRDFCNQEYSASWMSLDSEILDEFARWLSELEI